MTLLTEVGGCNSGVHDVMMLLIAVFFLCDGVNNNLTGLSVETPKLIGWYLFH